MVLLQIHSSLVRRQRADSDFVLVVPVSYVWQGFSAAFFCALTSGHVAALVRPHINRLIPFERTLKETDRIPSL